MRLKDAYEAYKKLKVPSLSKIRDIASEHSKTSLVIIILLVVILLLALQYIPHYQVAQFNLTNQKDLADAENSYRATLAQIFGGIAIAIGLYYTWRRIGIAEEDLKATQKTLEVAQEGQITERFTRAIDQLGSGKMEIRLGAIYALERIANESDKDYWPIIEILTAYIRKNSPINNPLVDIQNKISLDIQAILTVISRRKYSAENGEPSFLHLYGTYLVGANLGGSNLDHAKFGNADLRDTFLRLAHLNGAVLFKTNLKDARLRHAELENALFTEANLENADFTGANLKGAYNLTVDQLSKTKTLYKAQLDPDLEAELRTKGFGHLLDDEPERRT